MMITLKPISPYDTDVQALIEALDAYQSSLYPAESNHLDGLDELTKDNVLFLGAYDNSRLLGCGAVKIMDQQYGEIKRMFVVPEGRGRSIARKLVSRLEAHLVEQGIRLARLETGIHQHAAIALYEKCGYRQREPFGAYQEDPLSLFMEKRL